MAISSILAKSPVEMNWLVVIFCAPGRYQLSEDIRRSNSIFEPRIPAITVERAKRRDASVVTDYHPRKTKPVLVKDFMFFGETPTGLGGSTPQRVEQQPGVLEVPTIRRGECTQILAQPAKSLYLRAFRRGLTGIVKGRLKSKPRFVLTTEQTSGCYFVGAYNYRAIYALAPAVVKALNPWSPSKGHRYIPVAFSFL